MPNWNNVGKSAEVKAKLDSQNLMIGDPLITTIGNSCNGNNELEEGSKRKHGIAKKRMSSKPGLFK